MAKSRKKSDRSLTLAAEVTLRPRLDQLLGNAARLPRTSEDLAGELDGVTRGCKPDVVVSTLLRAYLAAPDSAKARLDFVVPAWLAGHGLVAALEALLADERRTLDPEQRARGAAWLEAAGGMVPALQTPATDFYRAFRAGNEWQADVMVFWYSSAGRNRVRGLGLLIDRNPPWEGAVKDLIRYPNREPRAAVSQFVDSWRDRDVIPQELEAAQAKKEVLAALAVNRTQGIRLPRDLIAERETFLRRVLALPDAPDTPPFSPDDFDHLSRIERTAESIMHFERTVGRTIRLKDGRTLLVDPELAEWD